MKRIFTMIFCVISIATFCQTYHFDYQIESSYTGGITDGESIYTSFYDSSNNKHMRVRSFDGKLRAVIADDEKNVRHLFKIVEMKGTTAFEYLNTIKLDENFKHIEEDSIEVIKINSLEYKILGFLDGKRKKKRFTADITLEKAKMKYLHVGVDHAKTDEMQDKLETLLDTDSNYIVKEIKLHYKTRVTYKISNKFTEVDFKISIPEILNLKNDSYWGI